MQLETAWTDMMAVKVGTKAANARAASLERLVLLPAIVGLGLLMLGQEGLLEVALFPDDIRWLTDRFPGLTSPEYAPYAFVVALIALVWVGARVVKRTMRRVTLTGLDQ